MNRGARLPDFLILGAAKAGTTALFGALSRHPRVFCSPQKEPRFFEHAGSPPRFRGPGGEANARTVISDEATYLALFAGCPPGKVAGEASTEYLSGQRAPAVAFQYVSQARLIAILRHPVERAYSQYLHLRQEGCDPLATFEAAWAAEEERIVGGWRTTTHYRARGFYGQALARWLNVFPREQLLVLFYEDWLQRPEQTIDLVCQHLGVEPLKHPVVRRENVSSRQPRWAWLQHRMVGDNRLRRWAQRRLPLAIRDAITRPLTGLNLTPGPPLDPALRARLAVVYHEDLKQVEALTQRDLTAWRS
jgi:hypothetical protein